MCQGGWDGMGFMDFYGFLWIFIGFLWIFMDFYGFLLGFSWVSNT